MDLGTILIALLRLVHIVAAVLWVGIGFTLVVLVGPAIGNAASSFPFLRRFYTATPLGSIFGIVAVLTTVAGLALYATGSPSKFSTLGNIVLGIGALAGLAAFGHGAGALSPLTRKLTIAFASSPADQPAPADRLAEMDALLDKYQRNARVSMIMSIVALLGMGLARYL